MAVLNDEQSMLRDMAREWAQNESPVSAFRAVRNAKPAQGFNPDTYQAMAQMGWSGVIVPEAHGGSDFGYLSLGLILEESGKTLTASPLLACSIAAAALRLAGDESQQAKYLPQIADGSLIATLAVDETPRHNPEKIEATIKAAKNGFILNGHKMFVAEGMAADLLIVAAKTDDGDVKCVLVPADAKGVTRSARHLTDARGHADVVFDGVSLDAGAILHGASLDLILDHARALTCAEMLGLAGQAFADTLAYLKIREQFDEILARFQALQHRMAHLFTEIELMRSSVEAALTGLDQNAKDLSSLVSVAKVVANQALNEMSREMIQLHGGIGMTDEHDTGFYIKRARILEAAWGNTSYHRERYAALHSI